MPVGGDVGVYYDVFQLGYIFVQLILETLANASYTGGAFGVKKQTTRGS